jgi:hypothetical protein
MKIYLQLLFFVSISTTAQIKGIVKDSLTGQPIPYVNIWVENENFGGTSEENGTFVIQTEPKNQTLIFSSIGFETKKVNADLVNMVVLKPIFYQLKEVELVKLKKTKELEIGDSKNCFFLPEDQVTPWILARKFQLENNNSEVKYLKNLIFFTKSETNETKFRARVFSVDNEGNPSEDLITQEIILKVKKGKKRTIVDVSAFKIEVPKEGVFVGFESLLTESNRYLQEARMINSKKTIKILNFGPHLLYSFENQENSYVYRKGKWVKQKKGMYGENINKVMAPAINIILTN